MNGECIEQRNGGYYVHGTRISLDSVVYAFNQGDWPERILARAHPGPSASWKDIRSWASFPKSTARSLSTWTIKPR
jgi:uncharacterized protein (DUF433 family)